VDRKAIIELFTRNRRLMLSSLGINPALLRLRSGATSSTVPGPPGGKGDKGDPFEYEDFTPGQLLALKGDPGEPGHTPIKGVDYFDGAKGDKGDPGAPGSNATVTKQAVESVLTGEISTHSHTGGGMTQQQIEGII